MNKDRIQIKVCGMRDPLNLEQLCSLEPDYVGFIFFSRSKRYVGDHPDPALFNIPGPFVKKVGVFVDEELRRVLRAIEFYGLDVVQLHGRESVEYCRELDLDEVQVIKALDPHGPDVEIERFRELVDLLLYDSAGPGAGGSGQKFDWRLLRDLPVVAPFLLSGGIGPGDAGTLRSLEIRGFKGVDINSRFELSPGFKDIKGLKEFFTEIRK
jgi:phosphoribosylanthranilate isomerase